MSAPESFTWIGPFTSASSAGDVARGFVHGFQALGHVVGALDSGDGSCARDPRIDCDGPVRWIGTTIVRQAPLSKLCLTSAILAPDPRARQVAYVVADVAEIQADVRAVLDACEEIWTPSLTQLELVHALGIERRRLRVVAPGVAAHVERKPGRDRSSTRVLLVGADRSMSPIVIQGHTCVLSVAGPLSDAFRAEVAGAKLVVVLSDVDPWGRVALEVVRQSRPLIHVDSGLAAEYLDADECTWIDAQVAADPRALAEVVHRVLGEAAAPELQAERARERIVREEGLEAATRRVLARADEIRVLPQERLARVLADLGLPTPAERLAGSRPNVCIVPVTGNAAGFRDELRRAVDEWRGDARTTICVWIDDACALATDTVIESIESTIGPDGEGVDVVVVTAPIGHAPREHMWSNVTSRPCASSPSFAG